MSHEIRLLEDGIVEIVHAGRMTIKEATASRKQAAAMMKARELRLVLADVSNTDHDESTIDLLEFNRSQYDVFPRFTRLAVVIPPDKSKFASAQFAENVAVNRGILMKIFLNKDEAMRWLRGAQDEDIERAQN
jgi:hypothetical protein